MMLKNEQNLVTMQSRDFNEVIYDKSQNRITKTSREKQKLVDEINWYVNLPLALKEFIPKIIDYSTRRDCAYLVMEYVPFRPLSEAYIDCRLHGDCLISVLNHLFDLISKFKKYKKHCMDSKACLKYMLIDKTLIRWNALKKQSFFQALLKHDLVINGQRYHSIEFYMKNLHFIFYQLFDRPIADFTILHGDLCFSNILYDFSHHRVKLIDPRGSFGRKGIYGDLRYDIAKLRHSVCGLYDFIVAGKYTMERTDGVINYRLDTGINSNNFDLFDRLIVENGYDITQIKFIEALLFLSMIPCHADSLERQLMLLARGVEQIDQVMQYLK